MAAVVNANRQFSTSTGVAMEISDLLQNVRQVAVVNTHATGKLTVKPFFSNTSAADALAKATAASAITSLVNDAFQVAPGKREVVVKSPKSSFVALQIISDTAATTYAVHGSDFFD